MKLPLIVMIEPVIYQPQPPVVEGATTSLEALCLQAGVALRATTPARAIIIHFGRQQVRTPHVDVVGVPVRDLTTREAALRALEALAHSFHDHAARACSRGLFTAPV